MHPDLAGIIMMVVVAVVFFAVPAAPTSRVVVIDPNDAQYHACPEMDAAWAVKRMDSEAAWVEYLAATADALAAYDTAADKSVAGPIYLTIEGPHREVYFARLAAGDAVFQAVRAMILARKAKGE